MVNKVTTVKTRVDKGSSDSGGSGKVKIVTDAMEVTNVVMSGARKGGHLLGKRYVRVEDEFEIPS